MAFDNLMFKLQYLYINTLNKYPQSIKQYYLHASLATYSQ